MKVTIDIPNPPSEQRIINIPIHFFCGQVVDAGGYGFEERKTGKWVRQGGIHNMYTRYACSECGREIDMYYDFGNIPTDADVINEFPYCHCGAKMEDDE